MFIWFCYKEIIFYFHYNYESDKSMFVKKKLYIHTKITKEQKAGFSPITFF